MEKFPVSFDEIESVCLPIRIWKEEEEEEEGVLWRACERKFEISFFRGEIGFGFGFFFNEDTVQSVLHDDLGMGNCNVRFLQDLDNLNS